MRITLTNLSFCVTLTAVACGGVEGENAPETSSLPIVVVSEDRGEVLAASAPSESLVFDTNVPPVARLAYANVDTLRLEDGEETSPIRALRRAKDLHVPILLESNFWDVAQVHRALAALFPGENLRRLKNVAVLAEWRPEASAWRLTDTTPAEMIRYLGFATDDSAASWVGTTPRGAWGGMRADRTLPFAQAAYDNPATVTSGWTYNRVLGRDVVKVYKATSGGTDYCVVAWRGTTSPLTQAGFNEWMGDLSSIVRVRPFYVHRTSSSRVGRFWNSRLQNQVAFVNAAIINNGCDDISVTGHSLGGAMATMYVDYLASASFVTGIPWSSVKRHVPFNPARVGNFNFISLFRQRINARNDLISRVYCRNGDPVRAAPPVLFHPGAGSHGCDVNGTAYDNAAVWRNHSLWLWNYCHSETSC